MALILAIQYGKPHLLGQKFTLFTNQKTYRRFLEQRKTTSDQQNWLPNLIGYGFEIVYKVGASNIVGDALSRWDEDKEMQAI